MSSDSQLPTQTEQIVNKFVNDGSFLEIFKQMQNKQQCKVQSTYNQCFNQPESTSTKSPETTTGLKEESKPLQLSKDTSEASSDAPKVNSVKVISNKIILGKRRNQKLKVGIIKRNRKESETESEDGLDAWTKYMREVRQYKEKYGDDSDKKRPLVK
ncbi:telomerase RNA component interacting RNase-like [Tetranychus urticae]|uniref:Telomerase RNA component interacting RNase n=1 Tax=Tetranychus urticae TaxID=32264 RepID=T1KYH2_TETUR|nr:telomerase RNA component interacting RNase-like [Tetranychus urticae]